jgi:hypothetical protein
LREQLRQAASAIHAEAADTAVLLEQRGELVTPWEIDYPTEIKRWRALAEFTEKMTRRSEQNGDSTAQRGPG